MMNHRILRTALLLIGVASTVTSIACRPEQRIEPAQPTVPPAQSDRTEQRLAYVNGQPIAMDRLYETLLRDYGLGETQQLIADEVVRQALIRNNLPIRVTQRDIEIENARALQTIFNFEKAPPATQMDQVLNQLLAQRNLTRRMWNDIMRRNARLTRLADQRIEITEKDLRRAFFDLYDGKLKIRHIQVPDAATAQQLLEQARRGADFEQLAFKYSTNPTAKTGAWLPDIGPRSAPKNVPPVLLKAARALNEPGQLSNIVQVGTNYHILKLERIIPPRQVDYEAVKDELRMIVRDRKISELQQQIMQELIRQANIEYVNPVIRAQVKRRQNAKDFTP